MSQRWSPERGLFSADTSVVGCVAWAWLFRTELTALFEVLSRMLTFSGRELMTFLVSMGGEWNGPDMSPNGFKKCAQLLR